MSNLEVLQHGRANVSTTTGSTFRFEDVTLYQNGLVKAESDEGNRYFSPSAVTEVRFL